MGFVAPYSDDYSALWQRLRELGWLEGQNLIIEARHAEGHMDRLPALMADVVGRRVDVIITVGTNAAVAARNATRTTPIVLAAVGDPVGSGLVASRGRPGGNVTGLSVEMTDEMSGKWLELLQETVPRLATVAVIWNPDDLLNAKLRKPLDAAAQMRHVELWFIGVRAPEVALDTSFRQAQRQAQAVLMLSDPYIFQIQRQIAALAVRHRLPDM